MPKIGPHRVPSHDIETVVELIDEAAARSKVIKKGPIPEDVFQEELIQRKGGSYGRYRASMKMYGFLERERGADEVIITDLFVKVADPVQRSERVEAISEAVQNIKLLTMMYAEGFEPGFADQDLRIWMLRDLNIQRADVQEDEIKKVRGIYEPAYQYLDRALQEAEESKEEPQEVSEEKPSNEGVVPLSTTGTEAVEEFRIGEAYLKLPDDGTEREWKRLKAAVDAWLDFDEN